MTTIADSMTDNRRAIVRIVAAEMVHNASSMARVHNNDVIEYIVFTAIWVLNSQHLIGDPRFAELKNIPPNATRKPVAVAELKRTIPMPEEILLSYLERLIEQGWVEKIAGGLVVPTAVFTQPAMLNGTSELYERVVAMVQAMRVAGFSFGDDGA
ncbi:hypothetical protein [Phenylobacterium sp.]|uniref:hypothetical protein n=1 Tax=Phenylobacterium sp. TaxID=1871053 RepID=UPI0035AE41FA